MTRLADKLRRGLNVLQPGAGGAGGRGATKALPAPDDEIPPSIIEQIEEVQIRQTKKLYFFRPSMLHGCNRANVFHYTMAPFHPQRQDPRMKRILDNGTAIHSVIQGYLADHPGWWFAPESRVYRKIGGAWIRGSCDGVLIRRSDGFKVCIEIKTISSAQYEKLRKPKPEHVFQASIYARLHNIRWITILYWNKNNQGLKEFEVDTRDYEEHWHKTVKRIKFLKKFVDEKRLPKYNPETCDPDWCQFTDWCRKKGAPI